MNANKRKFKKQITAVPLTARDMGRELFAETVTRKDAGASPMDGFTACLSKKLPIHVSVCRSPVNACYIAICIQ